MLRRLLAAIVLISFCGYPLGTNCTNATSKVSLGRISELNLNVTDGNEREAWNSSTTTTTTTTGGSTEEFQTSDMEDISSVIESFNVFTHLGGGKGKATTSVYDSPAFNELDSGEGQDVEDHKVAKRETPHSNKNGNSFTFKVSHIVFPAVKTARVNVQNMTIDLQKESDEEEKPLRVKPSGKNCTRAPVQLLNQSVIQEHYDCEIASAIERSMENVTLKTFYGGYVYRYTIPKENATEAYEESSINSVQGNSSDYYDAEPAYGEYTGRDTTMDGGLFPDPDEMKGTRSEVAAVPEWISAKSSATETTAIRSTEVNFMKMLMRGHSQKQTPTQKMERGIGIQILIVGAVLALLAQSLTLILSARRLRAKGCETFTSILVHLEVSTTVANLIFILGVQATADPFACAMVGKTLYYLHMVILQFFTMAAFFSSYKIRHPKRDMDGNVRWLLFVGVWFTAAIILSLVNSFEEFVFETKLYCWLSPVNMEYMSYHLPVSLFGVLIFLAVYRGLRNENELESEAYDYRKNLKIICFVYPSFTAIWFLSLMSLQHSTNLMYASFYLIGVVILNFFILLNWPAREASPYSDFEDDDYEDDEDFDDDAVLKIKKQYDEQSDSSNEMYPLPDHMHECPYNSALEPISIISSPDYTYIV